MAATHELEINAVEKFLRHRQGDQFDEFFIRRLKGELREIKAHIEAARQRKEERDNAKAEAKIETATEEEGNEIEAEESESDVEKLIADGVLSETDVLRRDGYEL